MNRPLHRRRGNATSVIVILLIVLVLAILSALLFRSGLGAGDSTADAQLYRVRRGTFDISVPCSGELEALRKIEVRNLLESRAVITYIAAEGATVEKGEELIHLSEEEILNRIKDAEDALNTARAALVAAEANLEIQRSARDSALDEAELKVELSQLALKGWLEGTVVSNLQGLTLAWEKAKIDYERLQEKYLDSIELEKQGYISSDELKLDEIRMIEARAELAQANLNISVYARYDYPQEEAQMESDVEQALAELERVRQRHEAELQTASSDVESKRYQVESRQERLDDLRLQHSYCSIKAPSAGLVVYASSLESSGYRGNDRQPPQVGTELRPNELVLLLPDTSQMIAAVKVNEALSGLIEPGQKAVVVSDALPDTTLLGEVLNIGVLAEGGGWRDPNRRDYTVRILLDTPDNHPLKPSMRCKADVHIERVEDALFMPIQAVFREGRDAVTYVPDGARYRPTQVALGRSSELFVEVLGGITEGESVLTRRPRPEELSVAPGALLAANGEGDGDEEARGEGWTRGEMGGMRGGPSGGRPGGASGRPGGASGRPSGDATN